MPTAGLPFQFQEWEDFERCVAQMEQVGMIADVTECRWDVRAVPAWARWRCARATAWPRSRRSPP
ncbi:glutamate-cysteine ligase family protein [Micrococcus sp. GPGPB33]